MRDGPPRRIGHDPSPRGDRHNRGWHPRAHDRQLVLDGAGRRRRVDAALAGHRLRLPSASTLRLHVTRTGLLRIDASRGRDQVEYLARLITGPPPAGAA